VSALSLSELQTCRDQLRGAPGQDAEARTADSHHHTFLFEEQPLDDLATLERVPRQERRPLGEEPEDRVRLRQDSSVVELERGRLARRIHRDVCIGQRVAGKDVDRDPLVITLQESE
jgi:hypothetical protein